MILLVYFFTSSAEMFPRSKDYPRSERRTPREPAPEPEQLAVGS